MNYKRDHIEKSQSSIPAALIANVHSVALTDNRQLAKPIQKKNNTGLPDRLKTGMENLSGMSLDHVKVHYNSSKPAAVQAHAYAQGSNIHVAPGQEKHLPHELGHVVQQAQGRVKPTTSVNGMALNDNIGLEKEADTMGEKALNTTIVQQKSKNVTANENGVIQRIGEVEAMSQITSSSGAGKTNMRRGNNRHSIKDTDGKSRAWIQYLRSDNVLADLRDEVEILYYLENPSSKDFGTWFSNRLTMIKGMVYKHVRFGNCGEFSDALYGELQQSTEQQYIYQGSWMFEEQRLTPYMKKYKQSYPHHLIKANSSDHAFVVTYPSLVGSKLVEYREASELDPDPSHPKPVTDPLPATPHSQEIGYRMSEMKKDQAMVADAWLNRKVKTLDQATLGEVSGASKMNESNALLTNPTLAGQHTLTPSMLKEITQWAINLKNRFEADHIFKGEAAYYKTIAEDYDRLPPERRGFLYGDPSLKKEESKDMRPAYVKAFHGEATKRVSSFQHALNYEATQLNTYITDISDNLIISLGDDIYRLSNALLFDSFLHLIETKKRTVFEKYVRDFKKLVSSIILEIENHVGQDIFDPKFSELDKICNAIPNAIKPHVEEQIKRISYLRTNHTQIKTYKIAVLELESLIGKDIPLVKFDNMERVYNTIDSEFQLSLHDWKLRADTVWDHHFKVSEFKQGIKVLELFIGQDKFMSKHSEVFELLKAIPDAVKSQLHEWIDRFNKAQKQNSDVKLYRLRVKELDGLIGKDAFDNKYAQVRHYYASIPSVARKSLQELATSAEKANEYNNTVIRYKHITTEVERLIGQKGFRIKINEVTDIYDSLPAQVQSTLSEWEERNNMATFIHLLKEDVSKLKDLTGTSEFSSKWREIKSAYDEIPEKHRSSRIVQQITQEANDAYRSNQQIHNML